MRTERCERETNAVNRDSHLRPSVFTPPPPLPFIHTPYRSHRSNPSMDSFQIRFIHSSEHPLATPTFLSTFPLQFYEIWLSVPWDTCPNLGPSDTARGITRAHEVVRRSGFAWIYLHVAARVFVDKKSASPLARPRSAKGSSETGSPSKLVTRGFTHTPSPRTPLPFFPSFFSFSPFPSSPFLLLPFLSLPPTDIPFSH